MNTYIVQLEVIANDSQEAWEAAKRAADGSTYSMFVLSVDEPSEAPRNDWAGEDDTLRVFATKADPLDVADCGHPELADDYDPDDALYPGE